MDPLGRSRRRRAGHGHRPVRRNPLRSHLLGGLLHGTSITLVAKPSPGSYLAGWRAATVPRVDVPRDGRSRRNRGSDLLDFPDDRHRKSPERNGGKAVTVTPSAPGTLSVRGKGLKRDTAKAASAEEPVALELDLSTAGRRAPGNRSRGGVGRQGKDHVHGEIWRPAGQQDDLGSLRAREVGQMRSRGKQPSAWREFSVSQLASLAQGDVVQQGNARISFEGELRPTTLPRDGTVPVKVSVGATISGVEGKPAPSCSGSKSRSTATDI